MEYDSKIRYGDNFEGNYFGSGDLILGGTFKGTIKIDKLIINENAFFIGNITAKEIIVEGNVKADMATEKLHIYRMEKLKEILFIKL